MKTPLNSTSQTQSPLKTPAIASKHFNSLCNAGRSSTMCTNTTMLISQCLSQKQTHTTSISSNQKQFLFHPIQPAWSVATQLSMHERCFTSPATAITATTA